MSRTEKPLVYIVLGSAGSGRRQIVTDLIADGLSPEDRPVVLLAAGETTDTSVSLPGAVERWTMDNGVISAPEGLFGQATHVFLITDGRSNPIDQIEAAKPWIEANGAELARIFTVVNCRLAEQNPPLVAWYEACIHFSDVVLLTGREGVANKWLSDFQNRFKDQFFPCLFELVKAGRVKNPALILEPEPRRVSHYFDETDWAVLGEDGDDVGDDEDDEENERDDREGEEEVEVVEVVDPYLERRNGGRRVKEIPDITKFLTS